MTMLQRSAAVLALGLLAFPVQAETLDLNLNSDAVQVGLDGPLSRVLSGTSGEYQLGALFSEDENVDFATGSAAAVLTGDVGAPAANVTAGLGVRAQFTDVEEDSGGGLAIGGQVDVRVPGFERIGAQAQVWFQPEVISFGEIEEQLEYGASLDYQVLRNGSIYVGYREVEVESEHSGGSFTADDGLHFGLRLTF